MQPIRRSQLVSVNIPLNTATGAKFFLPDIPELRDAIVDGLEVYTSDELVTSPQGNVVAPLASLATVTLSLIQQSDRRAQDFPVAGLVSSNYGGIWKEFSGWVLNWQKCYYQVTDAVGFENSPGAVVLNVFYHYPDNRRL